MIRRRAFLLGAAALAGGAGHGAGDRRPDGRPDRAAPGAGVRSQG